MKLETFFEKFALFADAPDAVPRMRRLVLDLAVEGKLVAQDPNDEPADELLKRVQVEKARLVKTGEIKKQEVLPPIADDALPFSLPLGWVATQLGDIAVCLDYMREPINGTERNLRTAGKNPTELFPYYGATQQQGWIDDYIFDAELVLLGEDGVPFFDDLRSKAYLISGKTWVNNHAHILKFDHMATQHFVEFYLESIPLDEYITGAAQPKLNQKAMNSIPIPIPKDVASQGRIVRGVETLSTETHRLASLYQQKLAALDALKKSLLHQAFSGELAGKVLSAV